MLMDNKIICTKLWEIRYSNPLSIRNENDKVWGEISEKRYVDHSRFSCYVAVKVPMPWFIRCLQRILFQSPSFDLKKVGSTTKDTLQEAIDWTEDGMLLHENIPE